jgi:hypothetical protein
VAIASAISSLPSTGGKIDLSGADRMYIHNLTLNGNRVGIFSIFAPDGSNSKFENLSYTGFLYQGLLATQGTNSLLDVWGYANGENALIASDTAVMGQTEMESSTVGAELHVIGGGGMISCQSCDANATYNIYVDGRVWRDWQATTAYTPFQIIIPTSNNAGAYAFEAANASASGESRPTFPQSPGATVTNGGLTFINIGVEAAANAMGSTVLYNVHVNDGAQSGVGGNVGIEAGSGNAPQIAVSNLYAAQNVATTEPARALELIGLQDFNVSNIQWYGSNFAGSRADTGLGGDLGIEAAIDQGKANGCLMAVHENYVDYYPNDPHINPKAVALNSDGSRMLSWFNSATDIQSFSTKPNWMVANAETQSPTIHASYGTTAGYLDVSSAVMPYTHIDMDASSPQAGMMTAYLQNAQALWNFERRTHKGPVFGEGVNHWIYSGLLDGVEARLGAGSLAADNLGESQPLFVDFDLLQIHPLQVNHGMGYYSSWTPTGTSNMTTLERDAYRMQEIAFGHAPFVGSGTWNEIPLAFVESNLVSPVAASYGSAKVVSIQYQVNGKWGTSSLAAKSDQFKQVQVAYDNGLALVANASQASLSWNGLTIPQFGWAAKSANLLAYTAQCGSTICDYAQTERGIFANSRNQSDAQIGWGSAAPSVIGVKQGAGRTFIINLDWHINSAFGTQINYVAFVHFVDDGLVSTSNLGIVFQGDHQPTVGTSLWQVGQEVTDGPVPITIPSSVPDGTYSMGRTPGFAGVAVEV